MTTLIVAGIVMTIKGRESKKLIIIGMISGIVPVILTTILLFQKF